MHSAVAPSVYHASQEEDDPHDWLATVYADQRWVEDEEPEYETLKAEALRLPEDTLVHVIADYAVQNVSATTNRGFEVYLDDGHWISVPFATDDQVLEWYG